MAWKSENSALFCGICRSVALVGLRYDYVPWGTAAGRPLSLRVRKGGWGQCIPGNLVYYSTSYKTDHCIRLNYDSDVVFPDV